jgi:uncharacterized protein (TIGR02996 family)
LREALEESILAAPDDRTSHAAYADYLLEQGDPRGEFIQVQLALEDTNLPAAERAKLQEREKELLAAHQAKWVGKWADLANNRGHTGRGQLDFPEPRPAQFVRGILAEVAIGELTVECVRAMGRASQARLLRKLSIGDWAGQDEYARGPDVPAHVDYEAAAHALLHLPQLANLRSFQFGWTSDEEYGNFCHLQCHQNGRLVYEHVRKMPRIEELYLFAHRVDGHKLFALPMPNLRVLQIYHSLDYPLKKLAANASLSKLTHVLFHPHAPESELPITLDGLQAVVRSPYLKSLTHLRLRLTVFGDKGVNEIIKSGILKRLKMLDLRHGRVSDNGAKALAACPEVKGLELLDLSRNELTEEGIAALTAAGVNVRTEHQHGPTSEEELENFDELEFLMEGDYE